MCTRPHRAAVGLHVVEITIFLEENSDCHFRHQLRPRSRTSSSKQTLLRNVSKLGVIIAPKGKKLSVAQLEYIRSEFQKNVGVGWLTDLDI